MMKSSLQDKQLRLTEIICDVCPMLTTMFIKITDKTNFQFVQNNYFYFEHHLLGFALVTVIKI